jgi:hypothetical protein
MSTPSNPFDSSDFNPNSKASSEAIDRTLAFCGAPQEALDAPGFYLLDDADGRFVVDRDWGVISLKDETVLEKEHGAIHVARLRVVEQSGETYELDLKLRLTGRVPQLVPEEAFNEDGEEVSVPRIHWTRYVAVAGLYTPASLPDNDAPYGSLLTVHTPSVAAGFAGLTLIEDLPSPAARNAVWTI